jgi:DNA gyrase subunit A
MSRRPPNKPSRRRTSGRTRASMAAGDGAGGDQQAITFGRVEDVEIKEEMERSYLDYSMSVIVARALPDVRDGLKPVQRRFLYAMNHPDLGARPDRPHMKCARITGDVTGKYHPYGTTAAYDALARLAQDFSLRYPLVDGHGNFGSPDDGPAAERYTEARLGALAMELLAGIEENTVDFVPNYTNELTEPSVLPARFPNLLVNGCDGIAVAMATKIPTHNLTEVINAAAHVLDNPAATPKDLMKFVKGPDFPTGAQILGRQGIVDAYTTGRGSIKVRAKAEIDEGRRGPEIVVTEIPYQTSVGSIAGRIAELVNNKQLDGIRNVNDASAKGQTRLVIELKRDANANVVLNNLWKHTALQTTFPVNMVALVDGIPRTLNLAQMVGHYVDHQLVVVRRRSQFRLEKAEARAHIVEGLLKALDKIDAIIKLIRGSADRDTARRGLMAKPFDFSEIQANHILDMTLAKLTRLGRKESEDEMKRLQETIRELKAILGSDKKLRETVKSELTAIRDKFGDERRTTLAADAGEMNLEDLIQDEEVVVVRTEAGYIKTVPANKYRTQGRGGRGVQGANLREADLVKEIVHTTTHAHLLMFSNQGRVFRLRAHEIPMKERTARGTALINLLPLRKEESIQAIIATKGFDEDGYLFFATKQGQVKKTLTREYDKSRREGFIAINLRKRDELVRVIPTTGADDIIMVTRKGQSIRFDEKLVRSMGRSAAGVRGIRLRPEDEVVSCDVVDPDGMILIVTDGGYGKRTKLSHWRRIGRGNQGIRAIKLVEEKKGYVVAAFLVDPDDQVFLVSTAGITVRIPVKGISSQGRDATGVRVMNLDRGQRVASASPVFTANGEAPDAGEGEEQG